MGRAGTNKKQAGRPLTKEEEADEIIKRLKTPPKKFDLEEEIINRLIEQIADEIDREIILDYKKKLNDIWFSAKK